MMLSNPLIIKEGDNRHILESFLFPDVTHSWWPLTSQGYNKPCFVASRLTDFLLKVSDSRSQEKKRSLLGNAETKTPQGQKLIFRRKEVHLVTAWPIWYVITEHHGVAFFYLLLLVRQNFHKFLLPQGINNSHNN